MKPVFFNVFSLGIVLSLIAGCGGSSSGITAGGGGGGSQNNPTVVTVTITGPTPTAVATAIGSAQFSAATLSSGKLTLSVPSGTSNFAVAYVCTPEAVTSGSNPTEQTDEWVYEGSIADGTALDVSCPVFVQTAAEGNTGILTASVDASAIPGAVYVEIAAANSTFATSGFPPTGTSAGNFSFAAPAGSDRVDVVAYGQVAAEPAALRSTWALAAENINSQAVPGALNSGSPVVLAAADQTAVQPLSFSGVPTGFNAPHAQVQYWTGSAGEFLLADQAESGYPALPATVMQTGDTYQFYAESSGSLNSTTAQIVGVNKTVTAAGPVSINFPGPWSYLGPTPAALPVFDLSYSGFGGQSAASTDAGLDWSTSGQSSVYLQVVASANYLNGSTTLAVPDLSGVSGFLPSLVSGQVAGWDVSIATGGLAGSASASGQNMSFVENIGSYKVP